MNTTTSEVPRDLLDEVRDRLARRPGELTPHRVAEALRETGRPVGDATVLAVYEALRRDVIGAGPLEPLLRTPGVTDVLVNGPTQVFLDRGRGLEATSVRFPDDEAVRRLAQRLAALGGRRLDDAAPAVDVRLPDGSRFHAVLAPVARPGTLLSLRVPRARVFSLDELIAAGTLTARGAQLVRAVVGSRAAFLVSGGTGTGKPIPAVWHTYLMSGNPPKNAVLLTRISDARSGDTKGVDDQEHDERQLAARLGWGVARVIVENDTSAFKRRKIRLPNGRHELRTVRPGFRQALDLLATGEADGMIAYDLDRACRDPRDLEDLIDVVESVHPRIPVESVTGSLKLANDADVTMARVLVAVANKSSRDTGRRVARARLRQASEGRYGGGRRPFGFDPDGTTVRPAEAAEIVKAADALLAGLSLAGVVADLNARGVASSTGQLWTAPAVRDVLLRPRNAGLIVYQGDIVDGVTAPWEPILPRERWEAVRALLTDPARRTTTGNAPRWLGSGLYRCGHPDCIDLDPNPSMRVNSSPGHRRQYRCRRSAHLSRVADPLDAWVERVIVARLSRPDAANLATVRADVDLTGLAAEANALRTRITTAGDLWESGVITDAELKVRRGRLTERLAKIEARMTAAAGSEPLAGIAGSLDAAAVWAGLDLSRRRAVLDTLAVVTVLPAPRGRRPDGSYFGPETVRIDWRAAE